jgi:inner membrane protein
VDNFTYHRGFSHAIPVILLLTPLLVWLILKIHPQTAQHRQRWIWLVLLVLLTHVLLDATTIYGTQLLWPFTEYPFGLGSLFIIDPLYTVPLLIAVISVQLMRADRRQVLARRILSLGLVLSTTYLLWSLLAQSWATDRVERLLAANSIEPSVLTVTPAPFNTLLWRFVARVDGGYHDGFVSLLDGEAGSTVYFHPSADQHLPELENFASAARLFWFTKGQFSIEDVDGELVVSDLRMGVSPDYVFNFAVAGYDGDVVREIEPRRISRRNFSWQKLGLIFRRIVDPTL